MPFMLPVSPQELLSMQQEAAAAVCDKPCAILRKAGITRDIYGSSTEMNYQQIAETIAGMRQPTGGELQNFDFMIGDKIAWTVLLPVGTDVQGQDHLLIEGQALEVHVVLDPHSYPVLLPVIAAEIKN